MKYILSLTQEEINFTAKNLCNFHLNIANSLCTLTSSIYNFSFQLNSYIGATYRSIYIQMRNLQGEALIIHKSRRNNYELKRANWEGNIRYVLCVPAKVFKKLRYAFYELLKVQHCSSYYKIYGSYQIEYAIESKKILFTDGIITEEISDFVVQNHTLFLITSTNEIYCFGVYKKKDMLNLHFINCTYIDTLINTIDRLFFMRAYNA